MPVRRASGRQVLRSSLQGSRIQGSRNCVPVRSRNLPAYGVRNTNRRCGGPLRLAKENLDMKVRRGVLLVIAVLASLPVLAEAQSLIDSEWTSGTVVATAPTQPDLTYTRPTEKTKLRNYVFDAFGPYPIAGAAFAAGIGQAYDTPPEWKQGAAG